MTSQRSARSTPAPAARAAVCPAPAAPCRPPHGSRGADWQDSHASPLSLGLLPKLPKDRKSVRLMCGRSSGRSLRPLERASIDCTGNGHRICCGIFGCSPPPGSTAAWRRRGRMSEFEAFLPFGGVVSGSVGQDRVRIAIRARAWLVQFAWGGSGGNPVPEENGRR
jgi:hypothetical protein